MSCAARDSGGEAGDGGRQRELGKLGSWAAGSWAAGRTYADGGGAELDRFEGVFNLEQSTLGGEGAAASSALSPAGLELRNSLDTPICRSC